MHRAHPYGILCRLLVLALISILFSMHQQYLVLKVVPPHRKVENPQHLPWPFALGVLGMPGQTAFMGWNEYSRAKKRLSHSHSSALRSSNLPTSSYIVTINMASIINCRTLFNSIPTNFDSDGYYYSALRYRTRFPEPGKTSIYDTTRTIDLERVALDGGILVKVLELSVDPYMRGRMRDPSVKSYAPAFVIGEPRRRSLGESSVLKRAIMYTGSLMEVNAALSYASLRRRDLICEVSLLRIVYGGLRLRRRTWTCLMADPKLLESEGCTRDRSSCSRMLLSENAKVRMGANGRYPSYSMVLEVVDAREMNERVDNVNKSFVVGSAGSLVIQLAKKDGLKVIGSAGSEENVQFMKESGADMAFNYKTTKTAEVLEKEGLIDVYWDNISGATLDAVLEASRMWHDIRVQHWRRISFQTATNVQKINGFIVNNLYPRWTEEFKATIPPKVSSREIKYREDIYSGSENIDNVILAMTKGRTRLML
ncbi:hypothetical protein BDN70DRAFT_960983 [Pholiota conissans]|uniref:Alcohol dehydrogenase-like C-terminal domain-containing protein n=1 Tax=Pholiota conissans TaxID=109636 RepID=A0A9P5YS38_9AGAR|nr:hypothetical protein BDN70DRAFT_960983 [Pholiota conissans]